MDLKDITHLFDYTEWANDLAMEAANTLSDENLRREVGISHKSIFGTLVHMAGAEWIWLERWNGRSPLKEEAWSQWSTESCVDLATLKERWRDVVHGRSNYVSQLDESRLTSRIRIQTAQRRCQFDATRPSNAACRESRDAPSRTGCRNDSSTGDRSTINRSIVLCTTRNFT